MIEHPTHSDREEADSDREEAAYKNENSREMGDWHRGWSISPETVDRLKHILEGTFLENEVVVTQRELDYLLAIREAALAAGFHPDVPQLDRDTHVSVVGSGDNYNPSTEGDIFEAVFLINQLKNEFGFDISMYETGQRITYNLQDQLSGELGIEESITTDEIDVILGRVDKHGMLRHEPKEHQTLIDFLSSNPKVLHRDYVTDADGTATLASLVLYNPTSQQILKYNAATDPYVEAIISSHASGSVPTPEAYESYGLFMADQVPGVSLDHVRDTLNGGRQLVLLLQMADIIDKLWDARVVHHDIKTANWMIMPERLKEIINLFQDNYASNGFLNTPEQIMQIAQAVLAGDEPGLSIIDFGAAIAEINGQVYRQNKSFVSTGNSPLHRIVPSTLSPHSPEHHLHDLFAIVHMLNSMCRVRPLVSDETANNAIDHYPHYNKRYAAELEQGAAALAFHMAFDPTIAVEDRVGAYNSLRDHFRMGLGVGEDIPRNMTAQLFVEGIITILDGKRDDDRHPQ